MAKLTLNADPDVIEQAKRLAAKANTSVSALFSRFIRTLASHENESQSLGPLTRKATGVIRLEQNQDYQDILADALTDKYGLS